MSKERYDVGIIVLGKDCDNPNNHLIKITRKICTEAIKTYEEKIGRGQRALLIIADNKGLNVLKETLIDIANPKKKNLGNINNHIGQARSYDTMSNAYFSEIECKRSGVKECFVIVTYWHYFWYCLSLRRYFKKKFKGYKLEFVKVKTKINEEDGLFKSGMASNFLYLLFCIKNAEKRMRRGEWEKIIQDIRDAKGTPKKIKIALKRRFLL